MRGGQRRDLERWKIQNPEFGKAVRGRKGEREREDGGNRASEEGKSVGTRYLDATPGLFSERDLGLGDPVVPDTTADKHQTDNSDCMPREWKDARLLR